MFTFCNRFLIKEAITRRFSFDLFVYHMYSWYDSKSNESSIPWRNVMKYLKKIKKLWKQYKRIKKIKNGFKSIRKNRKRILESVDAVKKAFFRKER